MDPVIELIVIYLATNGPNKNIWTNAVTQGAKEHRKNCDKFWRDEVAQRQRWANFGPTVADTKNGLAIKPTVKRVITTNVERAKLISVMANHFSNLKNSNHVLLCGDLTKYPGAHSIKYYGVFAAAIAQW